jgi:hypothetical protein
MSTPNSGTSPATFDYAGKNQTGFTVQGLFQIVNNAVISARNQLYLIQNDRSSISIGDMFQMQMLMNHLSQLSEMATDVVQQSNSAISSMARNIKG